MNSERSPQDLADRVKALALALGFDLAGVAPAREFPETRFLREWVARGHAGAMDYLVDRVEERVDPRRVLEGARSVVSVGLLYAGPAAAEEDAPATNRSQGVISRYARGEDYHEVMGDRLASLQSALEALVEGPIRSRAYVDTGPVQERVFAAYAGLGWIGKNTCLIHPELGSYLFLGVLLTDLLLTSDEREPDHCGSCRACLDACPTGAFERAYVLDATRCLAYTTIEDPGPIPEPLRAAHGAHVVGCDVCQEVCPWNQRRARPELADPLGLRARLAAREQWQEPALAWLLALDEAAWQAATRHSALRRAKHRGLLRNALVAAGNSGDATLIPLIEQHAQAGDVLLAEHARWALAQLANC